MKLLHAASLAIGLFASANAFAQAAQNEPTTNSDQKSESSSRIRLFGQNGVGIVLYKNAKCIDDSEERVRVSGGLGSAFGSLFGTVTNESIGIPETETTRRLSKRDGMVSKAYYKEYAIVSGKPVIIDMAFQDVGLRKYCKTITRSFVPDANADYEGSLDIDVGAGTCSFVVSRVANDGALRSMESSSVNKCN